MNTFITYGIVSILVSVAIFNSVSRANRNKEINKLIRSKDRIQK